MKRKSLVLVFFLVLPALLFTAMGTSFGQLAIDRSSVDQNARVIEFIPNSHHAGYLQSGGVAGLTTQALNFNGQITKARLTLQNKGNESIAVRLQFVDKKGKVLAHRDTMIKPGGDETLEFTGPNNPLTDARSGANAPPGGGAGVMEPLRFIRAQVGTVAATSIGLLRPTLRIVEQASGNTIKTIEPESFKEFNPKFDPPLDPAKLRPGNDPRDPLMKAQ